MVLMRGTTPSIVYRFRKIPVSGISAAYLTILPGDGSEIERDLTTATVGTDTLTWVLTQAETLRLDPDVECVIQLRYKTTGGYAGSSAEYRVPGGRILKDGVI